MDECGILKLHRFNGIEEFTVASATVSVSQHDVKGLSITFGIAETAAIKTLEDTAELLAEPEATATVFAADASLPVGQQFKIASAYDDSISDHVAWFYYVDHGDLDEQRDFHFGTVGRSGTIPLDCKHR